MSARVHTSSHPGSQAHDDSGSGVPVVAVLRFRHHNYCCTAAASRSSCSRARRTRQTHGLIIVLKFARDLCDRVPIDRPTATARTDHETVVRVATTATTATATDKCLQVKEAARHHRRPRRRRRRQGQPPQLCVCSLAADGRVL